MLLKLKLLKKLILMITTLVNNLKNGRNVLIFGVHENSLVHANNKANNIYVMGDLFVQGINDTMLYARNLNKFIYFK